MRRSNPFAKRYQAWNILLNTNSTNKKLIGPLKKVWQYITQHLATFCWTTHGGKILEVAGGVYQVEIGPADHKVHLHGYLGILGEGRINLDFRKIPDFVDKQLKRIEGFTGCYFEANLVPNANAFYNIKAYAEKGIAVEESDDEFEIEI